MIHREALASKTLPDELQSVLKSVIEVVNFIKSSALNTRLFGNLCMEMDSCHQNLLFYTEVRWLSKGNMLRLICDMKDEITQFLRDQKKVRSLSMFEDNRWNAHLCYLVYIFE